jgi:hypothetical protein
MVNPKIRILSLTFGMLLVTLACSLLPGLTTEAVPTLNAPLTQNDETLPTLTFTVESSMAPATLTPQPDPFPLMAPEFGVILVSEGDVLNLRSGPGIENGIIDTLDPHATGIIMTGNRQKVGNSLWVEVQTPTNATGWVNAHFLTEQIESAEFCNDPRLDALLNDFVSAVNSRDGAALAPLISPTHGLTIRVNWWNPEVNFKGPNQIETLFDDARPHDWGIQDGSGRPIQGAFKDEVLPWLDDVLAQNFSRHCNDLENGSGGSAGFILWPFEVHNMNYMALYRAPQPGDELNWRTWAVGISYHQGQPYIAFLVQYHWEI